MSRTAIALALAAVAAAPAPALAARVVFSDAQCNAGNDCGRVYVANEDGSDPVHISFSASGGRCSPTGSQLVYGRVRSGIWVSNLDGTGARLLHAGGDASWAPGGDRIVFVSSFETGIWEEELYSIRPDGSGLTRLTRTPDLREKEPLYSPDGRTILYTVIDERNPRDVFMDVWAMDADGSNRRRLVMGGFPVEGELGLVNTPRYSPDGRMLAFAFIGPIYTMTADGFDLRLRADARSVWVRWTADGSSLLFLQSVSDADFAATNLFKLTLAPGARPVQLTHFTEPFTGVGDADPCGPFAAAAVLPRDLVPPAPYLVTADDEVTPASAAAVSARGAVRARRRGLRLMVVDRTGVASARLAVRARNHDGSCRWLRRGGLGRSTSCTDPVYVRLRSGQSFSRIVRRLPRGTYRFLITTRDVRGNVSRRPATIGVRIVGR